MSRPRRIPGFATDYQAPLSVLLTQAEGISTIHETIFEDRMDHVRELVRMGADIELARRAAREDHRADAAPRPRSSSPTCAPAPRSSSPRWPRQGTSVIDGIEHVDRGYEQIEAKLVAIGASITRIEA